MFYFLNLGSKWTHEDDSIFGMLKLNGAKQNKGLYEAKSGVVVHKRRGMRWGEPRSWLELKRQVA